MNLENIYMKQTTVGNLSVTNDIFDPKWYTQSREIVSEIGESQMLTIFPFNFYKTEAKQTYTEFDFINSAFAI